MSDQTTIPANRLINDFPEDTLSACTHVISSIESLVMHSPDLDYQPLKSGLSYILWGLNDAIRYEHERAAASNRKVTNIK